MRVRELFDQCAMEYDHDRPKLVPCFNEFYGAALSMIPFGVDTNINILDLGAGTGLLSAMVAKAFPAAHLHLTDISVAMLAQAQQRFADRLHVTFAVQDHLQLAAESEYDLVMSALSIHHLDHTDKRILFQQVHRALRLGGMFINADQALGPTPLAEEEYERHWLAEVIRNKVSALSLEKACERMKEDKNAVLADQLQWLAESGFKDIKCSYQRYRFVVYGGRQSSWHGDGKFQ